MTIAPITNTVVLVPIKHFHVCGCCIRCGMDHEMTLIDGDPVICGICGERCSCPGCHAELEH